MTTVREALGKFICTELEENFGEYATKIIDKYTFDDAVAMFTEREVSMQLPAIITEVCWFAREWGKPTAVVWYAAMYCQACDVVHPDCIAALIEFDRETCKLACIAVGEYTNERQLIEAAELRKYLERGGSKS